MPYRTTKRGTRSYTRSTTRKRYGGTRRRTYPSRRRYTGRKRFTSRKMSSKRILNISSKKKKDVMNSWTNMDANNTIGNYRQGAAYMQGNNTYIIPWAATARPALDADGSAGSPAEEAVRTSTTCYMRGLKETISVLSNSGAAIRWRRLCVRLRGDFLYSKETSSTYINLLHPAFGMVRTVTDWGKNAAAVNDMFRIMFKGVRNVDWRDPMTAPSDNRRWDIVYDKTMTIQSHNDSGVFKTFRRWHGMNKNLVYDDDENGSEQEFRRWSVEGKQGMGDYYVIDLFSGNGADTDQFSVEYNSTLYWHEK